MSEVAYWDEGGAAGRNACIGKWGYRQLENIKPAKRWGTEDAEVLVAGSDERIVVAFAGSNSADDYLATDVNQRFIEPYDLPDWPLKRQGWLGVELHKGFAEFVVSAWPAVSRAVHAAYADKPRPVWVTGHSLGGAAAQIFAAMLRDDFIDKEDKVIELRVVTFGSPRAGELDWLDKYHRDSQLQATTERWVNHRDRVAHFPRAPYVHAGTRIHVSPTSCSSNNPTCWTVEYDAFEYEFDSRPSDIQYHALANYLEIFDWKTPTSQASILDTRCEMK